VERLEASRLMRYAPHGIHLFELGRAPVDRAPLEIVRETIGGSRCVAPAALPTLRWAR
jgi:hypothetical protein